MSNKSKGIILIVSTSLLIISMVFCLIMEEFFATIISIISCMISILCIYFEMLDFKS